MEQVRRAVANAEANREKMRVSFRQSREREVYFAARSCSRQVRAERALQAQLARMIVGSHCRERAMRHNLARIERHVQAGRLDVMELLA